MVAYIIGVILMLVGFSNGAIWEGLVVALVCFLVGKSNRSDRENTNQSSNTHVQAASPQQNEEQTKTNQAVQSTSVLSSTPIEKQSVVTTTAKSQPASASTSTETSRTSVSSFYQKQDAPLSHSKNEKTKYSNNNAGPKSTTVRVQQYTLPQTRSRATTAAGAVAGPSYAKALNQEAVNYLKNERGAYYLVHFTPMDNIPSILNNGILPRTQQRVRGKWTDENRLDNCLDSSSFSISFPNYQMFYRKRKERKYTYVLLRISVDALNSVEGKNIAYFPDNAASAGLVGTFNSHIGINGLKNMFVNYAKYGSRTSSRQKLGIPSSYTTYPQAEILVRGNIPAEYINSIIVENISDKTRAEFLCRECNYRVPIVADGSFFKPRSDWKFWKYARNY